MSSHPRGRMPDGTPNPIDLHVGSRIRLRRTLLGMSQDALGVRLGISFQQVQKLENGKNRVGASRLWDLSAVLKCPVEYFFEDMSVAAERSSPRKLLNGRDHVGMEQEDYAVPRSAFTTFKHYNALIPAHQRAVDTLVRSLSAGHQLAAAE